MTSTVYLAEKPKMGRLIAESLATAKGEPKPRKSGNSLIGSDWAVCWLAGHAYELFAAREYSKDWSVSWTNLPLPLVPETFKFKPIQGDFIESARQDAEAAIKKASTVVIATDAGQEGQIIAEIFLDQIGWNGTTHRLWTSAANIPEMISAIKNVRPNSDLKFQGHHLCGMARLKLDWLIGINLTVKYTNMARKAGYDFVASAGRVQSCLLAICVDHDAMIEKFKSSEYFDVEATFRTSDGSQFKAKLLPSPDIIGNGKHCTDEALMRKICFECRNQGAFVTGLNNKETSHPPPTPFNLTTLCIALNRAFDISSTEAMKLYQAMYEAGWLTYTRTDDTYFEDEQYRNIDQLMAMLKTIDGELAELAAGALTDTKPVSFNSGMIEEHSANAPTLQRPNWDALDTKSQNIYKTVAKQIIAQFYPPYVNATTTATISLGNHIFQVKGSSVIEPGWSVVTKPDNEPENEGQTALPILSKDMSLTVEDIQVLRKKTRAPGRMTEARLLEIMKDASAYLSSPTTRQQLGENASLGTAATRPGLVAMLVEKRKFLSRREKGVIVSTKIGRQVRGLLPPELSTPDLSALWEINFKAIRTGRLDPNLFIDKSIRFLHQQMAVADQRAIKRNPLSYECTECKGAMVRRQGSAGGYYWDCLDCQSKISDLDGKPIEKLPRDGELCPKCGLPFKTFSRNKENLSLQERREIKDLRYLMCSNKHFDGKKTKN